MSFLRCTPSVYVIGREYEISVNLNSYGLCFVEIGDEIFYEENSGVLPSERLVVKIRVPQEKLNTAKKYAIVFRETNNRKSYYSLFNPPQIREFNFKPLEKTENINIYHIADVHYNFENAKAMAKYFGEDIDLFVVNGDIGEVETEENFFEVCEFVGEISEGKIPVLFVRGNHDTRGRLAELYAKYFPVDGQKTYFYFEIGCLNGVALDCGEDKPDVSVEYDSSEDTPDKYRGLNRFHAYRQAELEFLKNCNLDSENKIAFAVSHVCPMLTTFKPGSIFDIERECYTAWNAELERMKVGFMLCGHYHKAFVLTPEDERNLVAHNYPVIVGSVCASYKEVQGAAITLNKNKAVVRMTDKDLQVGDTFEVEW